MHPSPHLTPETLTTARQVVTNPASFADDPDSRLSAWAALKAGRGQPMSRRHIGRLERFQRHYAHPLSLVRTCAAPEAPFFDGLQA